MMAATKQSYLAKVGYEYEASGTRRFVEGSGQVQDSLKRTALAADGLGPAAAGGVRRLTSQMDAAQREIEQTALGVRDLRADLERLDDVRVTPVIDVQQTGGSGRGNALESLDRVGSVGSQVLSGLGNSTGANAAGLLGDIAGAATSLNPVMLAVTAAGTGLALVLGENERRMKELTEAGEDFARRTQGIAGLAGAGTTSEGAREQIRQLEATRDATTGMNTELQAYQSQIAGFDAFVNSANDSIAQMLSRGATEGPDFERAIVLQEEIRRVEAQRAEVLEEVARRSSGTITSVEGLNAAFASNQTDINNTQVAIDDLNRAIEGGVFAYNDAAIAIDQQVVKTKELMRAQQELADAQANELRASAQEAAVKVKELAAAERDRANAAKVIVQQGISDKTDAYFNALEKVGTATASVTKAEQSLQEARDDQAARENKLRSDTADAVNNAEESAAEARVKLAETTGEEVNRITRRFNADYKNAQGFRDALAAHLAKQRADEELTDQREGASKQEREIEKSLTKQLQTISKNYNKQFAEVQQAGAKEINQRRQTLQQAQVDLANAQNSENATRKQYYTQTENASITHYNKMIAIAGDAGGKMAAAFASRLNVSVPGTTATKTISKPVINAPITINGSNMSPKQVEQTVLNSLGRLISMVPIR